MARTDFFWTDYQQARDRLHHTLICYDGQPYLVEGVEDHPDGIPRAIIRSCEGTNTRSERKVMNSPKFNRFRDLPRIGWTNYHSEGGGFQTMFLARRTTTGGRNHGLSDNNVVVHSLSFRADEDALPRIIRGENSILNICFNKGFCDTHNFIFPSLDKTLANIKERTAVAVSPMFCVVRSTDGLRWLYRNLERVGIFTGVDTLNLISKYSYLREEIMADRSFTLNNIREF